VTGRAAPALVLVGLLACGEQVDLDQRRCPCLADAGFVCCPSSQRCIRPGEQACQSADAGQGRDASGSGDGPADAPPGSLPLGALCSSALECGSGICVDARCCESECTGGCMTCRAPGAPGRCRPEPEGHREPASCPTDPAESCGFNGTCDGKGGCARHGSETVCKLATCDGDDLLYVDFRCDGRGVCIATPPLSCRPSRCQGGRCLSSCTSDEQCQPPSDCRGGSCGKSMAMCSRAEECVSGFCVEGFCCDRACDSPCESCALPFSRGRCQPRPAGMGVDAGCSPDAAVD
jgi:hypothetical protein